jgi:hypothetical protein
MTIRNLLQGAIVVSVCFVSQAVLDVAYADDTAVLPKGSWRVMAEPQYYLPWDKKFNMDGDSEPLGTEYNVNLNSQVFPALAPFGPGATLGQSVVSMERTGQVVTTQIAYGLTDRVTVGTNIPYYWAETSVDANLDTSAATLGINPGGPGGLAPCAAVGCSSAVDQAVGTRPAAIDDIQNLLVSLGFEKIQDDSGEGLGDIEVGARYQYFQSENFRAAFTGGVRFPTGFKDDPNNFVDFGLGNGVYAILFQFQQDYLRQSPGVGKRLGFPDPGEFLVNATVRYDLNLPDKAPVRVCDIRLPTCPDFDPSADRNVGDKVEAEISTKIGLWPRGMIFIPLYKYGQKFETHYSGSEGFDYSIPSEGSDQTEQVYILSLQFTTIPMFAEKQFPIPLAAAISYRSRFAGDNLVAENSYIGLNVQVYFK